jgi:DNA-nicking Smr family endonuclease
MTKSLNNIIFYDNIPKLDLHGYDSETARVAINDFIKDNQKMKNDVILVVHGNGSGILRKVTSETLQKNKNVLEYKGVIGNPGCTIVRIKFDIK